MSAGCRLAGIVILHYLFEAGIPVLTFQRAIRAAKGDTIKDCTAFAWHCHRCFAFKNKSVYICMTAIMGMVCSHPALQTTVALSSCLSMLGLIYVGFDRFIEYLNLCQQKRSTAFRGYDTQLQFTHYLKPLIHADAAWKTADGTGTGIDDGIPAYLYNDISIIRRKLRESVRAHGNSQKPCTLQAVRSLDGCCGWAAWHRPHAAYFRKRPLAHVQRRASVTCTDINLALDCLMPCVSHALHLAFIRIGFRSLSLCCAAVTEEIIATASHGSTERQ